MILTFIYVIYALVAVAMISLILMQRGAGAAAGSGFGGGASATVFGARGSSNFLSKATKWLAVVFFAIALGLAVYASKPHTAGPAAADLGVMSGAARTAPANATTRPLVPPQGSAIPAVPSQSAPAPAPAPASTVPAVPTPQPPASTPAAPNTGSKGG